MNNKEEDEIAVSPVIATILMVAITVVLAGVLYVWASSLAEGNTDGNLSLYAFRADGGIGEVSTGGEDDLVRLTMTQGQDINWASVSVKISVDGGAPITCDNPGQTGGTCTLVEFGTLSDQVWSVGDGVTIKESGANLCSTVCDVEVTVTDTREGKTIDVSSAIIENTGASSSNSGVNCGEGSKSIRIAGSSTVLPLAEAWSEDYLAECDETSITVEGGGSSAGAGRVCANSAKGTPVDIGDMSRNWKGTETQDGIDSNGQLECANGDTTITVTQLVVAVDGLSVVTKSGGAANQCINGMGGLTVGQLRWIFTAETDSQLSDAGLDMSSITPDNNDNNVKEWSDLSSTCDDSAIKIKYPDGDSGTYEYFYEVILDEASSGFRSGTQSADDNVLVNAILGDENSIGYFGYAYYQENQATLAPVAVANDMNKGIDDTSATAITPTSTTVRDGSYEPLSRPLFMNVNNDKWDTVSPFLNWAYSSTGQSVIGEVGYVSLDTSTLNEMKSRISAAGNY